MEQKVIFSTAIGRIEVVAEMEFAVDFEKMKSDDMNNVIHAVTANLEFLKPSGVRDMYGGDRTGYDTYLLSFSIVVMKDIEELMEQNKRNDERHQVNLESLRIEEIWIDGNTFRIQWRFTDCYGTDRVFAGHLSKLYKTEHSVYRESEVSYAKPNYLQVYF